MTAATLQTLFHPFERGLLAYPQESERVLVLGAGRGFLRPAGLTAGLSFVQGFRPDYLSLEAAGFDVAPALEGGGFDAALIFLGRHRGDNELRIAEVLRATRPGGTIVAAGAKTDGAASLRKRLASKLDIGGHAAKNHGVVFWLTRPEALDEDVVASLAAGGACAADGFETAPGGFSHDGIDAASRLLLENLPEDLGGRVADFGAGWGYLAAGIAERFADISKIDLYEAHCASLEAARRNLAKRAPNRKPGFFWHDLLSEPVAQRYDAIVMNPPFHQSRTVAPEIGGAMIRAAAKALVPRGRLFLVANRPLPYEPVLEAGSAAHGEIVRDTRFKVLWSRR